MRVTAGTSSSTAPPVLRFAPSPNGKLHLGYALSALIGFEMAKRLGGRFLVRIEDIDETRRARPEFVAAIFEDLQWLGVAWETPVLHQPTVHVLCDADQVASSSMTPGKASATSHAGKTFTRPPVCKGCCRYSLACQSPCTTTTA